MVRVNRIVQWGATETTPGHSPCIELDIDIGPHAQ